MKARLSLFLLLLLTIACHKDGDEVIDTSGLWSVADKLFQEAADRNVSLDKSKLTIKYVDASEISPYAGYGNPATGSQNALVRIVKARWDAYTDMQKEVLMFHEIGHALLGRVHTNERLPDCSSFKSIMNENSLTVYTNSSIERREYYVDELLDAFAEYPSWAPLPPTKVEIDLDPSTFTFVQTQQAAHTGNVEDDGSLHIGVGGLSGDGTSSWNIPIPTDNIPIEGTFELKVKIKTQMIPRGTGASVSINSDLIGTVTYNASTAYYGFSPIAATTTDFVPLTLKLNCYQISKPKMFVSLTMDGQSIGDAWFTDIELNYYHN